MAKPTYEQFYGIEGEVVLPKDVVLERLIKLQCSATRAIYKHFKKGETKSDVYKTVKPRFPDLPSRYFNAVVAIGQQLPVDEKVICGGKKNWRR